MRAIAAVIQARVDQLEAAFATLECGHPGPKARLKALVGVMAEQGRSIAQFGCPYGTPCSELVKRVDVVEPLAARLMQVRLDWVEQQFRSLGQPELIARRARRFDRWIDALTTSRTRPAEKGPPNHDRSCRLC